MMTSSLPSTLVVLDIDHTLSDPTHRWKRLPNVVSYFRACDQDEPVTAIVDAVRPLFDDKDVDVIFVTARPNDKVVVSRTKEWLGRFLPVRPVFFRPMLSLARHHVYKDQAVQSYRKSHHQHIIIIDNDPTICRYFEKKGHQAIHIEDIHSFKNVATIEKLANDFVEKRFRLGENCLAGPPSKL